MRHARLLVSPAPFVSNHPDVSRISLVVLAAIVPIVWMLVSSADYRALANLALALAGVVASTLLPGASAGLKSLKGCTPLVTGAVAGLLLPTTISPIYAFAVPFVVFLVARTAFGGYGSYWANPAMATVCVAYLCQPDAFPPFLVSADGIRTAGDAFSALKLDQFAQLPQDQAVTGALNLHVLGRLGIRLPDGYVTLFWNSPSVIPAFRYNVIIIAASIVLIALECVDTLVPAVFIATYAVAVRLFSLIPFGARFAEGDVLFALLTGGVLFTAFFVLPDTSTTPRTRVGKVASGFISGSLAFLICGPGGTPVGCAFTVVAANCVNLVIELAERRALFQSRRLA